MSPLAVAIYRALRALLRRGGNRITYADLASVLRPTFPTMHARNRYLYVALGDVVRRCNQRHLPKIAALVWRKDLNRPGPAYYSVAHPQAASLAAKINAWRGEHAAVLAARQRYPPTI
jgi:hypothetical protein